MRVHGVGPGHRDLKVRRGTPGGHPGRKDPKVRVELKARRARREVPRVRKVFRDHKDLWEIKATRVPKARKE